MNDDDRLELLARCGVAAIMGAALFAYLLGKLPL